jgi:hypothetical protein
MIVAWLSLAPPAAAREPRRSNDLPAPLAQSISSRQTYLLGSGGHLLENDRFERGYPRQESEEWRETEEGQPIERLPSWLRDTFRAVPEIREFLADIESRNDTSEQLRFELFAAARNLNDALRVEEMPNSDPVYISYGDVAEARGRRRFVVAMFSHLDTCASIGCEIRILIQEAGRWRLAGEAQGDEVSFEERRMRGYPVLVIYSRGEPCYYRWNGATFSNRRGCQ